MTPEGRIIAHAKKECRRLGLRFVRLSLQPGVEVGWPDVIVLGPERGDGRVMFMETKAPGKQMRPIQKERARELVSRNVWFCKADTRVGVTARLEEFAS